MPLRKKPRIGRRQKRHSVSLKLHDQDVCRKLPEIDDSEEPNQSPVILTEQTFPFTDQFMDCELILEVESCDDLNDLSSQAYDHNYCISSSENINRVTDDQPATQQQDFELNNFEKLKNDAKVHLFSVTDDKPATSQQDLKLNNFEKLKNDVKVILFSVTDDKPATSQKDFELIKFEKLKKDVKEHLFSPYVASFRNDGIEILELYNYVKGKTSIKLVIDISSSFHVQMFVHRKEVSKDHYIWNDLPKEVDDYTKLCTLLTKIQENFEVCIGNPDEEFQDLAHIGSDLSDNSSVVHAYREGDFCARFGYFEYSSTIRSVECHLLVEGRRCNKCISYRRNLRSRKVRSYESAKSVALCTNLISSKRKHCDMNKDMLIKKIQHQQSCIKTLQSEVDRHRRELDRRIKQAGVSVPDDQNDEMLDLLKSCQSDVEKASVEPTNH